MTKRRRRWSGVLPLQTPAPATRRVGIPQLLRALLALLLLLSTGTATIAPAQQLSPSQLTPLPGRPLAPALIAAQHSIVQGKFEEAESALRAYLSTDETSGDAHYLLAYTLLRRNQPRDSLAEYTRAAALQKPVASDLISVAQDYVLLVDYPDADKWISRAIAMDPQNPDAWYSQGRLRYTQQRFQDAIDAFVHTLALSPRSVKAENNLGLAYESLNRNEEAVSAYRQAIAWQAGAPRKDQSEQPLLNLAIVLLHHGQLEEALTLLLQADTISPHNAKVLEQLGHLYLRQGDLPKAQQQLEEAVALRPQNAALHFLLGQVYHRQGAEQKAKTEFDRSTKLNGTQSTPEE